MDQFLAMRAFRCIVESGGFSAAAERLETTHSTVSRQLKQLESSLGVQLLNRNTRRLALTAAGEGYYAACVDILDRVCSAAESMTDEQARVAGRLRVSVPHVIGTLELPDWLPAFQERYPDIRLDLSCSDRFVDLVDEGFDAALRISGPLADTTLMARSLAVSDIVLVASPAYRDRRGLPMTPEQLAQHERLAFSGSGTAETWSLTRQGEAPIRVAPRSSLSVDAITALYAATLAGAGVAAFTRRTVQGDLLRGSLVPVLPDYILGKQHYHILYPQTRHLAPKVRVFVDYMVERYRDG
ncbi:LysR family transcriptional regulator [Luteibacter sp. NPDC031894]|uniref:LysR family transcriptional regulator n=1 Tax=Luteibacter sp. NPDC031894 TaxID=3390572 RepID=UPI003D005DF5